MHDQSPEHPSRGAALPRGRLSRTAPLAGLTLRTAGAAGSAAVRRRVPWGSRADDGERHARAAHQYAELLGRSRGALMKAGQLLSVVSLGPAVPAEYQEVYAQALARLQDDAVPMPPGLAVTVLERELGRPAGEVFREFGEIPIAAASIGQVHAARLHDGRRVAVKIQYPGVDEAIRCDLRNGELLVSFLRLGRGLAWVSGDVDALSRELAARISEELDYLSEAAYQAEFAAAYRGHPFIRIPEVIPELCTGRVLTADLADGRRWVQARTAGQALRDQWGEVIYRFALGSMARLRMVNADPQPGNFLFHDDGTVTFLDFGCVRRYGAADVTALQLAAQAVVDRDAELLSRVFGAAGYTDGSDAPDPGPLLDWLTEALAPIAAPQPFTFTPDTAEALVRTGLPHANGHSAVARRMTIPPSFVSLSRVCLGLTTVLGTLRAAGQWDAIRREYERGGPATPLGFLDAAFLAARGDVPGGRA